MSKAGFLDAALVLLGHGSTESGESGATVYQHAAEIRSRSRFADVREAFWKQEPKVQDVLASVTRSRVFIVPFFMSEGYFASDVIPRALGFPPEASGFSRLLRKESTVLAFCNSIGTHSEMTEVTLACARNVVAQFPFPRAPAPQETTLLIAGHGTERNKNSRASIDQQVETLRKLKSYADVHGIFLDEEPRIKDWHKLAATEYVIVVPYFISDGMHTARDIPILLGEPKHVVEKRLQARQPPWRNPTEMKDKLIWYSKSVGSDPRIADVIISRAEEAAAWFPGT